MSRERAEELLDQIRALSRAERWRLVERVVRELAAAEEARPTGGVLDLFADEPELIEAVIEGAMHGREHDPSRFARG